MSSLINKAKEKVAEYQAKSDAKKEGGSYDNPHSTNQGPHGSNMSNTADPRVDSDNSRAYGSNTGTHHAGTTGGYGSNTGAGYGDTTTNTTTTTTSGTHYNNPQSTNQGPHSSNLANVADPRVDSDASRNTGYGSNTGTGHHGTTHHTGTTGTTGGYGSSTSTGYDNPQSTNQGPHRSNIANYADPRVDSDQSRNTYGGTTGTTGTTGGYGSATGTHHAGTHHTGTHHTGTTGTTGGYGSSTNTSYDNPQTTNQGPHSSNIANYADPRVDSDSSKNTYGGTTGTHHTGTYHTGTTGATGGYGSPTTTGGYGSNTGYDGASSTNTGPHNSSMLNKLDPRVDSDRDRTTGTTGTGYGSGAGAGYGSNTGTTGTGYGSGTGAGYGSGTTTGAGYGSSTAGSTNYGPHDSNLANKADPRVDSDRDGRHTTSHTTPGSGNANNTAGPHNSNLLNKLDPRVDSDMDGSKTQGGNRTFY